MDKEILAAIITGIITFFSGYFLEYIKPKAKLAYWFPHSFLFNLQNENVVIRTDSITVQNLGRVQATDLEIVHDIKPDFYQIWPAVNYNTSILDNGNHVIKIAFLGANEYITIQILSYKNAPHILSIRSKESIAVQIPIQLQRVYHWSIRTFVFAMILFGSAASLFLIFSYIFHLFSEISHR